MAEDFFNLDEPLFETAQGFADGTNMTFDELYSSGADNLYLDGLDMSAFDIADNPDAGLPLPPPEMPNMDANGNYTGGGWLSGIGSTLTSALSKGLAASATSLASSATRPTSGGGTNNIINNRGPATPPGMSVLDRQKQRTVYKPAQSTKADPLSAWTNLFIGAR